LDELVLSIDAGTSGAKVGLLDRSGRIVARSVQRYGYATPRRHHAELDFLLVWKGIVAAVRELECLKHPVRAVGLSVLCPGLVPLDRQGSPLRPAIIHLDRRSVREGRWALERIGSQRFLAVTANLPYPGGCSASAMLWLRTHEPDVYRGTHCFGHTNTFLARRLTGRWGMDPTNASFSGLYDTMGASGWDPRLAEDLGLDLERLPPIVPSTAAVGTVTAAAARELGLREGLPVAMGAADSACAALGAEVTHEGEILNATGTVEVMVLATTRPVPSADYLTRTHVLPGWWLVLNIIPTGGEAIEWARREFYRELAPQEFYERLLPRLLLQRATPVRMAPYLSGDRTRFRQRTASYRGISLQSTRDDLLLATCRAVVEEMSRRYRHYEAHWKPTGCIRYTGGGAGALLELKKQAFPAVVWEEVRDATLKGAAKMAWEAASA
jgi:xylulokinase